MSILLSEVRKDALRFAFLDRAREMRDRNFTTGEHPEAIEHAVRCFEDLMIFLHTLEFEGAKATIDHKRSNMTCFSDTLRIGDWRANVVFQDHSDDVENTPVIRLCVEDGGTLDFDLENEGRKQALEEFLCTLAATSAGVNRQRRFLCEGGVINRPEPLHQGR